MEAVAQQIADRLRRTPFVRIVTHIDTDGITGGAIASEALDRAGIRHEVAFVKKLDDALITELKREGTPLVWFVDLGAGMLHALQGLDAVITDHHVPTEREVPKALRGDLIRFAESQDRVLMLNPHLEGEGSDVASGAGCAYAVAKALDPANTDLAAIAIVGAVGDVQDQEHRRLSGYNRTILADGVAAGVVEARIDLRLFGRETRPAYKMLQYATDPWIPRLSGNEEACIAFLLELGIDLKVEEHWRSWSDLDRGEKQRAVSALAAHMLERGCGISEVERLIGETYTLVREPSGSPTRDAKEFGTLMNACGRYDEPDVGYRVCRGDRGEFLAQALRLLRGHREYLMESMDAIAEAGINQLDAIQYFHAADRIRDTVVGIAASLALNQEGASRDLPIIAFAEADDGIKVSARTTRALVARGLDLAAIMQEASRAVGGQGGGHHAAAGATIPPGTEQKFLEITNRMVREQLGSHPPVSGETKA
ncbi:MAG TPA: DHH family phosphoesterase [Thermoplasmata archaeon]|nr:DHH family phosphoesterase [Thermoplasmata archaeon]